MNVEMEGRLASDPRSGPGYIETVGGRILELGEQAPEPAIGTAIGTAALEEAGGMSGEQLEQGGILKGVVRRLQLSPQAEGAVPVLLGFLLVGSLCFELGAYGVLSDNHASPPPPPMPTRAYPAAERVSLTVSEQKARQALRVSADQKKLDELRSEARSYEPGGVKSYEKRLAVLQKRLETDQELRIARDKDAVANFDARAQRERDMVAQKIANMELRLRQDEEGLVELTRSEVERGAGSAAVQLGVFPSSAVDTITARTIPSGVVAAPTLR